MRIDGRGGEGEEGRVFFPFQTLCGSATASLYVSQQIKKEREKNLLLVHRKEEFTPLMSALSVKLIGLGVPDNDAISDSYQEQKSPPPQQQNLQSHNIIPDSPSHKDQTELTGTAFRTNRLRSAVIPGRRGAGF